MTVVPANDRQVHNVHTQVDDGNIQKHLQMLLKGSPT